MRHDASPFRHAVEVGVVAALLSWVVAWADAPEPAGCDSDTCKVGSVHETKRFSSSAGGVTFEACPTMELAQYLFLVQFYWGPAGYVINGHQDPRMDVATHEPVLPPQFAAVLAGARQAAGVPGEVQAKNLCFSGLQGEHVKIEKLSPVFVGGNNLGPAPVAKVFDKVNSQRYWMPLGCMWANK